MKGSAFGCARWLMIALILMTVPATHATWSIVMADTETHEIAVGTVTCLLDYDLLALVPVVVVGKGAAAVQAAGDFSGARRPIIFEHLQLGTSPEEILQIVADIPGHYSRQYGIVDTTGGRISFTGVSCTQWAGGVVGTAGTLVYAIQGNILAGDCVVPAIEGAILNTAGDIPVRLMAGMEAARVTGGDGRCSCSTFYPTYCGCPPEDIFKSGHIGGMIVARIGDADDDECTAFGCADGDYFMRLNVPNQMIVSPDPVLQLQEQFGTWRAGLAGRADAVTSTVDVSPQPILPDGMSTTTMFITLLDWESDLIAVAVESLTVTHAPDSAGLSTIGEVIDHDNGTYSVTISAGSTAGTDRFHVTADDGIRPVVLMPDPSLTYYAFGDINCDGRRDFDDIDPFVLALSGEESYDAAFPNCNHLLADCDRNGAVDFDDIDPFVALLGS